MIRCLLLAILLPLALWSEGVICFSGGECLDGNELVVRDLWVADGKIVAPQERADVFVDATGLIVSPGLIDLQINGGYGVDFSSQPQFVDEIAARLLSHGVTSFLPTVISSAPSLYREVLPQLQPRSGAGRAHVLGVHLEGPFLARQKRGCHDANAMRNAPGEAGAELERCYGDLSGVRLVTVAPERSGVAGLIGALVERGIVVSAGHTMTRECPEGVTLVTHLFNGMRNFHHRDPGLVGTALTRDDLHYSLICDGVHVHPAAVKLAWRAHPKGLVLVTDAMAAMGMEPGRYQLAKREVVVSTALGARLAGSDTLAGSTLTMDEAVRNFHAITGCTAGEALAAASLRPAQVLGISGTKGSLSVGADGDVVLFDQRLQVLATYLKGERAWPR